MRTTTFVKHETALMAKKIGFKEPTKVFYEVDGYSEILVPNGEFVHLAVDNKEIKQYTNGIEDWNTLVEKYGSDGFHLQSSFSEADDDKYEIGCSAPTKVQLKEWLKENYGLCIDLISSHQNYMKDISYRYNIVQYDQNVTGREGHIKRIHTMNNEFELSEAQALELALQRSMEILMG